MTLTPERIRELWENYSPTQGIESFARSIEAAVLESQSREIAALKEQVEGLSVKAARYDWLRDNWFTMSSTYKGCITFITGEPRWSDITEEQLDSAIDAAIAAKGV